MAGGRRLVPFRESRHRLAGSAEISRGVVSLGATEDTKEFQLHRQVIHALSEVMGLAPESCWLHHDVSARPLVVNIDSDASPVIKFEESHRLEGPEWPRVLHPLRLPLLVVLGRILVERPRHF